MNNRCTSIQEKRTKDREEKSEAMEDRESEEFEDEREREGEKNCSVCFKCEESLRLNNCFFDSF